MNILDDLEKIKKLDKAKVYHSILRLGEQCWDAWRKVKEIKIPADYDHFANVVICGMGGSCLGADVIRTLYRDELQIPLVRVRNYQLPGFVDQKTLVVLSSYSGNTEEILACAQSAIKRKLKIFIITSGGQLKKLAKENKLPFYLINPVYNPCGQPRMAIGYSVFGQLALFARLGLIDLSEEKVKDTVKFINSQLKKYRLETPLINNPAKQIARTVKRKIAVIVASEHLIGAAHVFNNQLNENAKHFSELREIPELNHHLMEGLAFPETNQQVLVFLFIFSHQYHPRNQIRFQVTKKVVEKNKVATKQLKIGAARSKLEEAFGLITLGGFIAFYTAMMHQLDPAPIPWVDFFKKKLKKAGYEK